MMRPFVIGVAALTILFVVDARPLTDIKRGRLEVDVSKENEIRGSFFPKSNSSEFFVRFYVEEKEYEIVSKTEIVRIEEGDVIPFTTLKIPISDKFQYEIENMHQRVLQAAKDSFIMISEMPSFPTGDQLEIVYEDLANSLYRKFLQTTSEMSELTFSIMYHSTIVGSVRRLIEGATDDDDICTPSMEYTTGERPFVCEQDLGESKMSLNIPSDDSDDDDEKERSKRAYSSRSGRPRSGRHWGCCGNYAGPCRYWADWCWRHDCACQCCEHWHCGWACGSESWCGSGYRVRC